MIKLNHKNEYVRGLINNLVIEYTENNDGYSEEINSDNKGKIFVTIKYKGYMWKTQYMFSRKNYEFLNCGLLEVWQLDDCTNPIFEV